MKCPNCGYVSYLKVDRCLRCGSRPERGTNSAPKPAGAADEPSTGFHQPDTDVANPAGREVATPVDPIERFEHLPPTQVLPAQASQRDDSAFEALDEESCQGVEALDCADLQPNPGPQDQLPNPWREELSERLERLRQRRGRSRNSFDASMSLDLAFNHSPEPEGDTAPDARLEMTGRNIPSGMAGLQAGRQQFDEDFNPRSNREPQSNHSKQGSSGGSATGQWSLGLTAEHLEHSNNPLRSGAGANSGTETGDLIEPAALGPRFFAGMVDALVLLAAGCLFALIFWIVGGHMSLNASNAAILGLISVVGMVGYFALFVASTSRTPGMALAQLEVRSLEGGAPSISDSVLRALGYLVSTSALMLGFVWAAVDSERLTWHDRMSGTCVTLKRQD